MSKDGPKDTKTQRYWKDTKMYKDTKIQRQNRYKDVLTKYKRYKDIAKYKSWDKDKDKDTKIQRYKDKERSKDTKTKIQRQLLQRHKDTQRHKDGQRQNKDTKEVSTDYKDTKDK
jgi:hypothetical protein